MGSARVSDETGPVDDTGGAGGEGEGEAGESGGEGVKVSRREGRGGKQGRTYQEPSAVRAPQGAQYGLRPADRPRKMSSQRELQCENKCYLFLTGTAGHP